ncbi:MAG TPA: sigma-54 dependent transcriptional regulator [Candidatus Sumerlaeota bacterium]|nr:sigma-54 dependent transcriptional regulator [Candidatus Sumerlaeota bacterium]
MSHSGHDASDASPWVLVADDDPTIRLSLKHTLERAGLRVLTAADGREAIEQMTEEISAAILDLKMPGRNGLECLTHFQQHFPDVQVVMITATNDIRDAVEAMKLGAYDYITKPFSPDELIRLLRKAVAAADLRRENRHLRSALGESVSSTTLLGQSLAMRQLRQMIGKVSRLDSTVLLLGESGVGKSLVARCIHRQSPRAAGPFVTVNCTAMPRELMESELFGHERGAFTGALERRLGRLEMAQRGSLFLDEIGDLPIDLQPKLLSFLQERVFHRVGGSQEMRSDVRIIAATNHDLRDMVNAKMFREDLYYRLNVLPITIPPLRDRREDLEELTTNLLARIARNRGARPCRLSDGARRALLAHDWPGNVRELENALERATAFCENFTVMPEDLPAARFSPTFAGILHRHARGLAPRDPGPGPPRRRRPGRRAPALAGRDVARRRRAPRDRADARPLPRQQGRSRPHPPDQRKKHL